MFIGSGEHAKTDAGIKPCVTVTETDQRVHRISGIHEMDAVGIIGRRHIQVIFSDPVHMRLPGRHFFYVIQGCPEQILIPADFLS